MLGNHLADGWSGALLARLVRRAYARATAVVAVSNGVADDLARWERPAPCRDRNHLQPGGDAGAAPSASRAGRPSWFQPGAPPVILGAGRLGRAKDFPTLVRAFARLPRRERPARLVIIEGQEGAQDGAANRPADNACDRARRRPRRRAARLRRQPVCLHGARRGFCPLLDQRGPAGGPDPGHGVRLSRGQHRLPERTGRDPGGRPLRPARAARRRCGARGRDRGNP